jgi:predicted transcriptional regulator
VSNRLVDKKKRKLIKMDDRFFDHCILIMKNLSDVGEVGIGVNDIIAQTSSDRSYVIDLIKVLAKCGLVSKENADPGKVKPVKLTELGLELKEMAENIHEYTVALKELRHKRDKHVPKLDTNTQERKKVLENSQKGKEFVESICTRNMVLALMQRYFSIHYKYQINKVADTILIKIISNVFTDSLSNEANIGKNSFLQLVELFQIFNPFLFPIIRDVLDLYTRGFYTSSIETLNERIRNVILAILKIAKINEKAAYDAMSLAEYIDVDMETIKTDHDEEYLEHLAELKSEYSGPKGIWKVSDSEELRKRDLEELESIFRKFTS